MYYHGKMLSNKNEGSYEKIDMFEKLLGILQDQLLIVKKSNFDNFEKILVSDTSYKKLE